MLKDDVRAFLAFKDNQGKVAKSTVEAYRMDLEFFIEFMDGRSVTEASEVTGKMVDEFIRFRETYGRSRATVRRNRSSVRALFGFLLDKGIVNRDPCRDTVVYGRTIGETKLATRDEIAALVRAASGPGLHDIRDLAVIEVLYGSGLGTSELASLKVSDYSDGMLRGKVVGAEERAALENYLDHARSELYPNVEEIMFPTRFGGVMERNTVRGIIAERAARAGIKPSRISPRILRASRAAHLYEAGVSIEAIKRFLGLKDMSAITKYCRKCPLWEEHDRKILAM